MPGSGLLPLVVNVGLKPTLLFDRFVVSPLVVNMVVTLAAITGFGISEACASHANEVGNVGGILRIFP